MRATVISVTPNVTKLSRVKQEEYTCTEFTYQADPKNDGPTRPPTTRNVFDTDPLLEVIMTLEEGDYVQLDVEKPPGKSFFGLVGVKKIAGTAPTPAEAAAKGDSYTKGKGSYKGNNSEFFKDDHPDKAKRIGRSVAVKSSIDMILGFLAGGVYKKSVTPDFLKNEILTSMKFLENYLYAPTSQPAKQDDEKKKETTETPKETEQPEPPPIEQPDDNLPF